MGVDEVADELVDVWLKKLEQGRYTHEELVEMMRRADDHAPADDDKAPPPLTREEVYDWWVKRTGFAPPTVAVCEGHTAHFDVIYDIVTFKVQRLLWVLNRGGGKTSSLGECHIFNAEEWPGYSGMTIGAGLSSAEKVYEVLLPYVVDGGVIGGKELDHIVRSTSDKTYWKNGSMVEIAPPTTARVNGPRHPRLHRDEREILVQERPEVDRQSVNIPAGKKTKDGRWMPAQIIDTSTMKWAHGVIAKEMKEYKESIEKGDRPVKDVKVTCLFECAAEIATCRCAPKTEREERLTEMRRDPTELCECDQIKRGDWGDDDRTPRTLESVCAGRLFRSRGWKPFDDIETLFLSNPRRTWEAEQECRRASGEGVYVESFDRNIHGIKRWDPDPDYGDILMSADFSGGAEGDYHAIHWWQCIDQPMVVEGYGGKPVTMPAGSYVCFDEIFRDAIGNIAVGKMVVARENEYRKRWPGWRVSERYPDNANRDARRDWADELGLITVSRIKKEFGEEVKYVVDAHDERRVFYVIDDVIHMVESLEGWRADANGREVHDELSHCAAGGRYFWHNRRVLERKQKRAQRASRPAAVVHDEGYVAPTRSSRPPNRGGRQVVGGVGFEGSPNRRGGTTIIDDWQEQTGRRNY